MYWHFFFFFFTLLSREKMLKIKPRVLGKALFSLGLAEVNTGTRTLYLRDTMCAGAGVKGRWPVWLPDCLLTEMLSK